MCCGNTLFYFSNTLKQYRLCHDLAATIDTLESSTRIKLDGYAIEFHDLSCFCATLAEKVGTVWCGTCCILYRNLGKLCNGKDPSKLLKTIAGNASGLSKDFERLADSSNVLATKFKTLETSTLAIQDVFIQAFKEEERQAKLMESEKQQQLEETRRMTAAVKRENSTKNKSWYKCISDAYTYWPTALSVGEEDELTKAAEQELQSAKQLEDKLEMELKEAQAKLREQIDLKEKAKVYTTCLYAELLWNIYR